ncbi:MAG TPA: glycosyltransferase family 2 protein [Thermomicrobiales bacterium]|nr:glycosyltransferase family 2 protein [Thermomicrobiales bacterium]
MNAWQQQGATIVDEAPRAEPSVTEPGATLPALSVVVPFLNEVESLPQLCRELRAALDAYAGGYELIFVDDGSTDGSASALAAQFEAGERAQVIQFRRNFGKSAALAAGFAAARGELVVTLDADLQDIPAEIPTLLAPLQRDEADLVSGWKADRQDPLTKTLPSALFNRVVRVVSGVPLHDFNCGFKAYRRDVLDEVPLYGELHRYIPVLAHFRGFRVAEVRVPHRARRFGRSKFGPARFVRGFFDLLTVLFLTQYTRRPLHLFGLLGAVAFGLGFGVSAYLAFIKLALGEPIGHRPLLTLGVLLIIVGTQFFVFGLLGEMIAHHARTAARVPGGRQEDYSIRRVLRNEPPQQRDA